MKTERNGFYLLDPSKDEIVTPFYEWEAAALIKKVLSGNRFTTEKPVEGELKKKVERFQEFEKNLIEKARVIIEPYKDIKRYFLTENIMGPSDFFHIISIYYFFERTNLIKDKEKAKAFFFSSFFEDLSEEEIESLKSFEYYYKKLTQVTDDLTLISTLLDLYVNFEEIFERNKVLFHDLIKLIKSESKELLKELPKRTSLELIEETNEVFEQSGGTVSYGTKHVFLSLVFPNGISFFDNLLKEPILIVGSLAHDLTLVHAMKKPLSWKCDLLKALSDPVRYQILLFCKERPHYLSELAERLELKPSTVSHHINALLEEHLLVFDFSDKPSSKTYYKTVSENVNILIDELKDLL
ncbi:ArsR/SmtB family transcription factor [Guggenheimella bovis]